jgi:hypothetical protein
MITKTETQLAKALGYTRAALAQWRKDYLDAPSGRDVVKWRTFLTEHNLGQTRRENTKAAAAAAADKLVLQALASLCVAEQIVSKHNQAKGAAFRSARIQANPICDQLFTIIEGIQ